MLREAGNRRWWAAGALALSCLVIGIDGTVLTLALPTLAVDLHASTGDLQWFVNAYLLVLGAAMIPAGLLGDSFGRRRLLLLAQALFGVGSLGCAYASTAGQLVAARVVLGLAAAFILPLSLAVVPVLFAEHERQRAIAVIASAAIVAYPIGPILGGWLLTHFWWGSVFLINIPVVVLGIVAIAALLPESRSSQRPRFDLVGILLCTVGLVALTYGLIEAGQRGWGDPVAGAAILAGAVVLAGFVGWERRLDRRGGQPVVDLGLFASASFSWGTVLATTVSFALLGVLFTVPQYLRDVLGFDAMDAGVRLLPLIAGMFVGLASGDRVSALAGTRVTVALGLLITAAALGVAGLTSVDDGTRFLAAWITVLGVGAGVCLPATVNAALGRLTEERSGAGSALVNAIRQVGGVLGVAVLGSVLNSTYRDRLELDGLPPKAAEAVRDNVSTGVAVADQLGSVDLRAQVVAAFVHGGNLTYLVCATVALAGAVAAAAFLPAGTAERRETVGSR